MSVFEELDTLPPITKVDRYVLVFHKGRAYGSTEIRFQGE